MILHVSGLGVVLLGLLGAGVIAIETGSASTTANVTTNTPGTTSGVPSGTAMPSASPAETVTPSAQPSPTPSASPSKPPPPAPAPTKDKITRIEDEVTTLINKERAKAGCGRVRTDERMRKAARAHSADMAEHDYFSHTGRDGSDFVDRLERAGYPSGAAGENIAYGYRTAESVVQAWMDSKGHRDNILNCDAEATGVGLAYRGNTPYWTQLFGRV